MIQLPIGWNKILKEEFEKPYIKEIKAFLASERKAWKIIFPEEKNVFRALELTKFDEIKVVILGQDPYHQKWQAHWLSFSVQDWVKIPPSLRNIYKEIDTDIGYPQGVPLQWNLESWAKQWVLLLNSILTVEDSKPASHWNIWWEQFSDTIIKKISENNKNVVFLLWWAFAKSKVKLIDSNKHFILETSYPSPLWSYRGFLWSKHFSKTNSYLEKYWKEKINW